MVNTLPQSAPKQPKAGIKEPSQETILTPRFYTTDFETAVNLDLSAQETELTAMLEEMRSDYNRHHFVRDEPLSSRGNILMENRAAPLLNI